MHKVIIYIIFVIYLKDVICNLLELEKEDTTETPMDIAMLNYIYWCKFQPNEYDCGENNRRNYDWYYFDLKLEDCKKVSVVGDCKDNRNAFSSLSTCKEVCREHGMDTIENNLTANVYCRFQFDFGDCEEYHPMWYFDMSTRSCKGFSYSGCGGNQNKFATTQDCTSTCLPSIEYLVKL